MKKGMRKLFAALILGMAMVLCFSAVGSAATYKNKIVTTKKGYKYYFDKNGNKVKGKYGYKIGSKYYRISKTGVLKQVSEAEGLAGIAINKYYGKYSKSQILWKAFKTSAKMKYYTNPVRGKDASYFGRYGFKYKRGDCNVQAATFYWTAKVLGYKAKFVQGYVPTAQDKNGKITSWGAHAWVTIQHSGKTYVYDPNFVSYCQKRDIPDATKRSYKFRYGTKGTFRYFNSSKKEIKK